MPRRREMKSALATLRALAVAVPLFLLVAVICGIVSTSYASKADRLWNTVGYRRAYNDLLRKAKVAGKAVSEGVIAQEAKEEMFLPKYVPESSRTNQGVANRAGTVGFLSTVLAAVLLAVFLRGVFSSRRPAP